MFDSNGGGDSFGADTRAIEGLPVRLVVALVVGVASLSMMMNMLAGVQGLAITELDVRPAPEMDVVAPGEQELTVTVVDPEGNAVSGAMVIVDGGTAQQDGVVTERTGADGRATVSVSPTLRANQDRGTLTVDIKPPAGSQYVDRRENTAILVIRDSS